MTTGQAERGATGRVPARRAQPAKRAPASSSTASRSTASRSKAKRAKPAAPRTTAKAATPAPAPRATAGRARAPRAGAAPARPAERATARNPAPRAAQRAAAQAIGKESGSIGLPWGIGPVRVPSPDRIAFYGGIAALALIGIVDWPVALVIGVGHALADDHHHKLLADFGEALGEA